MLTYLTHSAYVILGGGLGVWVGWGEGEEESQGYIPVYYEACLKTQPAHKTLITRKMVPITGRARSFLLVFTNKIERRGRQNKNNRPINLHNVITFSTDFKYTLYHTQ